MNGPYNRLSLWPVPPPNENWGCVLRPPHCMAGPQALCIGIFRLRLVGRWGAGAVGSEAEKMGRVPPDVSWTNSETSAIGKPSITHAPVMWV
ncbi:MAG: hypothetical protein KatS3mg112_1645 [Thermogutta sp.]|nr:MAG: hypothetical protein KatS3mg112_1645 [Thermogutta sp.]